MEHSKTPRKLVQTDRLNNTGFAENQRLYKDENPFRKADLSTISNMSTFH